MSRDLGQRGQAAAVLLDRKHAPRALGQQPAGQAARPWPDFEDITLAQVARCSRNLGGQIQIELV